MSDAIIVFGRQGCGKTRNAERIRKHFKCSGIVDNWMTGEPLTPGHVHLTNDSAVLSIAASPRAYRYEELPADVRTAPAGLKNKGAKNA